MSTPVILYQAKNPTDCKPQGQPRPKFLLPAQSPIQFQAYLFDQEFSQRIDLFPPFPKNTPGTSFSLSDGNAILVQASQPKDRGAALGDFTATFARVPATWNDYKMMPFSFPGFPGILGANSRDPFSDVVSARIQHDYFVLDPANIISGCSAGAPANATSVKDTAGNPAKCVYQLGDIAVVQRTFFVTCLGSPAVPDFAFRTNVITPIGGINNGAAFFNQTLPSLANYKTWIANAIANQWQSTVWNGVTDAGGSTGQIIAEDSRLQDYSGCIVDRQTVYVLVK